MPEGNQAAAFNQRQQGTLPGVLGIAWEEVSSGRARGAVGLAFFLATSYHVEPSRSSGKPRPGLPWR